MDASYIEQLERELDLTERIPNDMEGVWSLPIDEGIVMTIAQLSPGYSFQATIARIPETGDLERLYTLMMLANVLYQGTEGCTLGLNEAGTHATLYLENPSDASYAQFSEHFEDFLNAVDYWKDEVQNLEKESEDTLI